MNKKNKLYLLLTLGILFCVFFSCSDNNEEPENPPVYADLTDVSLKQTVNGKESFELTEIDEELNFSSQLEFNGKTINWSKPSLELSFSSLFVLSADNITVTDSKGATVTQAEYDKGFVYKNQWFVQLPEFIHHYYKHKNKPKARYYR